MEKNEFFSSFIITYFVHFLCLMLKHIVTNEGYLNVKGRKREISNKENVLELELILEENKIERYFRLKGKFTAK